MRHVTQRHGSAGAEELDVDCVGAQGGAAGRTAVLSNVVAYWLIPLSVLILGERVSAMRWFAAGLSLVGSFVLIGPWAVDWGDGKSLAGYLMLMAGSMLLM